MSLIYLNKLKSNFTFQKARTQPQSLDNDDSIQFQPRSTVASFQSSQRSSAFEVYRKPTPRDSTSPPDSFTKTGDRSLNEPHSRPLGLYKNDSKNLNDVMCHLKDQNQILNTICSDLSDELLTLQQKKAELLAKIECDVNNGNNSSGLVINKETNNQSIV